MGLWLHAEVRWVRGPAAGALYDRRDGRIYPVGATLAPWLDAHVAGGGPLDALAADAPEARAHLAVLAAADLTTDVAPAAPPGAGLPATHAGTPKLLWLELTGRCNYTCVHCYADSSPTPSTTLPDERWFELIREAGALGFPALQLTGGDPTMHPRLLDFVAAGHEAGIGVVEVYTNAAGLRPETIERFAEWGTHVAVSFYSDRPEVYEAITQARGGFRRAVRSIERMLALGVPLRVGLIEMDENREDVPRTVEFLTGLGVDPGRIRIDGVRPSGRGVALQAHGCGTPRGPSAASAVVPLSRLDAPTADAPAEPPIWRAPMGLPRTYHATDDGARWNACWHGELVVDPHGDLYPCIFARTQSLGNVAATSLAAAIAGEPVQQAWDAHLGQSDDCTVCEYRFGCFDCRALTQNVTGRTHAKPPSCTYDPHAGRFQWQRWLDQQPDRAAAAAVAVVRTVDFTVAAEGTDHVVVQALDERYAARLDMLAATVLDLADGRPAAAIAAAIAEVRGEPLAPWRDTVLCAAWELEARGLVRLTAAVPVAG